MDFSREITFRPLGVLRYEFLHALEINQDLLEHTPRGTPPPSKKKKRKLIVKI